MSNDSTCFTCFHGEPEGRDRSKCLCLWPCVFGGESEYIESPTKGECAAYEDQNEMTVFEQTSAGTI